MKKEIFMVLRLVFNNLDLDLQPQHKLDEEGLEALKKTRALFNKEFETLTVKDFEEVAIALEDYQNKFQLVGGIFDKAKMN
jgi:hypothetical protein